MQSDLDHVASLADAVRRFLTRGETSWSSLVQELGLLEIALEDLRDNKLHSAIHRELGRALTAVPFSETLAFANHLSGQNSPETLLANLRMGAITVAIGLSEKQYLSANRGSSDLVLKGVLSGVAHARQASHVLLGAQLDGEALLLLAPVSRARVEPRDSIDDLDIADLYFENVPLPESSELAHGKAASDSIAEILDQLVIGQCAEAIGLLEAMIAMTRDYALGRKQFGQSIASFQVNRHRFADMQMALARSEAIAEWAHEKLGETGRDRGMAMSAAKVEVADALREVREHAVQIHGAMGLTDEMAISRYFRCALALEQRLGNADYHLRRYAELAAAC